MPNDPKPPYRIADGRRSIPDLTHCSRQIIETFGASPPPTRALVAVSLKR